MQSGTAFRSAARKGARQQEEQAFVSVRGHDILICQSYVREFQEKVFSFFSPEEKKVQSYLRHALRRTKEQQRRLRQLGAGSEHRTAFFAGLIPLSENVCRWRH